MKKTHDDYTVYGTLNAAAIVGGLAIDGISNTLAKLNTKKADAIFNAAQSQYMDSLHVFEDNLARTKKTILSVVCLKKQIMKGSMKRWVKAYKRLNPNIKLQPPQGLGELSRFKFDQKSLSEIKDLTKVYQTFDESQFGENSFNVALLMIQDGTISNLTHSMRDVVHAEKFCDGTLKRAASDNLKIQSIDVLAQFSTTAFMTALTGISSAFASGKQLNAAKKAAAQFEYQKELIAINNTKINAIEQYATEHLNALNACLPLLKEQVSVAAQIIKSKDNFFHFGSLPQDKFTEDELNKLSYIVSLGNAVKAIVSSPIISQNGEVFNGDNSAFHSALSFIKDYERHCLELKS